MDTIEKVRDIDIEDTRCLAEGCSRKPLYLSGFCWEHIPDKDEHKKAVELNKESLSGANFVQADLTSLNFFDADLSGADLVGANLSGADLTGANLRGADLTKANLTEARLWHADLTDSKLSEADLTDADLWQARLFNVRLWRADIYNAKSLTKQNFMLKKNKFITVFGTYEKGHLAAEEVYRNLKRYFIKEARYNDASWASFKEKSMEKVRLRRSGDPSYIPVAIMGLLCGYGEKPQRIVSSSFFLIFAYAMIYYLFKSITLAGFSKSIINFEDYLYYSVVTFTTLGYGDMVPKASTLFRLLAGSEAFLGAFMMGLFVFTLARKYSAR